VNGWRRRLSHQRRDRRGVITAVFLLSFGACPVRTHAEEAVGAEAGFGRVRCAVEDNGQAATGSVVLRRDGVVVAEGSCRTEHAVPAGDYDAVISLDGALDRPTVTERVRVAPGATATVSGRFRTGSITVEATANGRRAAVMATLAIAGRPVGTLAGGVEGRLSAGSYEVTVTHRGQEQRFTAVAITPGQLRLLSVQF
jgi:hypothetical protein